MVFNSLTFVLFFAVVLAVYYGLRGWRAKKSFLLVASYAFYAAWNPPLVMLLWLSTAVDWHAARRIAASEDRRVRRRWLVVSLATNLGLLGFFKYGSFLTETFATLLDTVGVAWHPPELDIILPVGISFYTFQTLSYTIDVYRGRLDPWPSLLDFALYVTFFPQLVAGPIVRAVEFLPQTSEPRRAAAHELQWGLVLLTIGLFEKVVVADAMLGPVTDAVYDSATHPGLVDAWLGTLAFAGQIFCDFAGYSTCAIGVAMCLGFKLPDNFRYPYGAIGFSDFWRRWHISLSAWLRDYLYISLGGNRVSNVRTHVNLMLTMLLGGLWHGAAWTFVVWGALHGLYLVAERVVRRAARGFPVATTLPARTVAWMLTFVAVCVAWVFFRAGDFETAFHISGAMLLAEVPHTDLVGARDTAFVVGVTVSMLGLHLFMRQRTLEGVFSRLHWAVRGTLLAAMLISLVLMKGDDRAFIYFQF